MQHVWPNEDPGAWTFAEWRERFAAVPRRVKISFGWGARDTASVLAIEERRARLALYEEPDVPYHDRADDDEDWIPVLPGDDPDSPDFVAAAEQAANRAKTRTVRIREEDAAEGEEFVPADALASDFFDR
jgi:hypothetical protein